MAAPHAFLTYSIKDAKGKTSITQINFPYAVDIGQVSSFAVDTATMINNLIKGKITDAGVGLSVDISGATIRSAPDINSDVEEGARFSWRSAIGAITNFRLPTFDEAFLVDGTKNVDTADTTVDTFVQRILQGKTTGLVNASPSDDHGSDIATLEAARESFKSSRGD
jgi:hypothetical protein